MSRLDEKDKSQTDVDERMSLGKKFANAARGTLSQRLSIALPVLLLGFVCLLLGAFIESLL